jgi:hypothetical protein
MLLQAISLTMDLLWATLPIPMIWNVQVGMNIKVAIAFVMSLGALEVFSIGKIQLADGDSLALQLLVRPEFIICPLPP